MNGGGSSTPLSGGLAAGRHIAGRYALERRIAVGGMGEVWEATDERLGRAVAVKVLRSELSDDDEFLHRFRIEARTVASLNHSGVAAIHDYGEDEVTSDGRRTAYLVMELVRGEPLSTVISRGPLPPAETLRIMEQAAHSLYAAHERGFVHRDVKPGNILIRVDGAVKLTDFGIAKAANAVPVTRTGMVMGTAHYIAPEQASGGEAGPEGDVYSLGIVGYECLAGHRPFRADNAVAVAMMQVRDQPPPLPDTVPWRIRQLIEAILVKDPEQRYADGAELAAAISAVRRDQDLPVPARLAERGLGLPTAAVEEPEADAAPRRRTRKERRRTRSRTDQPTPAPGEENAAPGTGPSTRAARRRAAEAGGTPGSTHSAADPAAGGGTAGGSRPAARQSGSGEAGSGQPGSGQAGAGLAGSGGAARSGSAQSGGSHSAAAQAGAGQAAGQSGTSLGSGKSGTGHPGTGTGQTGGTGSGRSGSGHSGTGTGHSDTGHPGAGTGQTGGSGTGRSGTGSAGSTSGRLGGRQSGAGRSGAGGSGQPSGGHSLTGQPGADRVGGTPGAGQSGGPQPGAGHSGGHALTGQSGSTRSGTGPGAAAQPGGPHSGPGHAGEGAHHAGHTATDRPGTAQSEGGQTSGAHATGHPGSGRPAATSGPTRAADRSAGSGRSGTHAPGTPRPERPPVRPAYLAGPPAPPTEPLKLVASPARRGSTVLLVAFVLLIVAAVVVAALTVPKLFADTADTPAAPGPDTTPGAARTAGETGSVAGQTVVLAWAAAPRTSPITDPISPEEVR